MSGGPRIPTTMLRRAVLSLARAVVALAAALFFPAGSVAWVNGWVFIAVFVILTVPSIAYVWHTNPDIFAARSKIHERTKGWDKALLWILAPSTVAIYLLAALDAGRMHWSSVPLWLIVVGYILLTTGYLLCVWVYRVNKFAEPGVRIQTERGQKVIDTGPYAIVRHPLYVGGLLLFAGSALALGSYWALVPAAVASAILIVRIPLEERTLREGLEGYEEYASRVRYRLLPGIW
jgi:protein-S-isoprenylcysteine O-methyltransferase Ste14